VSIGRKPIPIPQEDGVSVQAGARLKFEDHGLEVVVTRGGEGTITAEARPDDLPAPQIGKRFTAENTGVQVLVTKPSQTGALYCDGVPMTLEEPKATKSSD